jgi:hypothetical protein
MMNWYLVLAILPFVVDGLISVYDFSTDVPSKTQSDAKHRNEERNHAKVNLSEVKQSNGSFAEVGHWGRDVSIDRRIVHSTR